MYIASCLRRNRFSAARADGDRRRRYRKIIASTKTEHTVRTNVRIRNTPDDIETASHKRRRPHAAINLCAQIRFLRSTAINGKLASIKAWAKESGLYTLEVDRAADSITLTIGKAVKSSKPAAKKTTKTPVA